MLDKGTKVYEGPTTGAIRKYLELLSEAPQSDERQTDATALVRNVRFLDADGREVLEWRVGRPAIVELELVVRKPMGPPAVLMNVASVGGVYLGTCNSSRQGVSGLTGAPGTYPLRFIFDPLPLAEGDFTIDIKIHDTADQWRCVWSNNQPRTLSVRGGDPGPLITCDGRWELLAAPAPAESSR